MKKKLLLLPVIALGVCLAACNGYDDSKLWEEVNSLDSRVTSLETRCNQMNQNILALQGLITALQQKDAVTSVSALTDNSGYLITFSSGKEIRIYHGTNGKDGSNGSNGTNGKDGKDGHTPQISVKQDTDGVWYWTVDGEWLYVDGQKVRASAKDGQNGSNGINGQNGTDGVTPKFKIEEGSWFVSYDGEKTWSKLGVATGANGLNGEDGDAFFNGVTIKSDYVVFTLNDGLNTEIKLPFVTETQYSVHVDSPGTLSKLLPSDQRRRITSLKISGTLDETDMKFINCQLSSLENLDLSKASHPAVLNPFEAEVINRSLRNVSLGSLPKSDVDGSFNISYCIALETVTINTNNTVIRGRSKSNWFPTEITPSLSTVYIAEGISDILLNPGDIIYAKLDAIHLPSTLKRMNNKSFRMGGDGSVNKVISHAIVPPDAYSPPSYYGNIKTTEWTIRENIFAGSGVDTLYVPSNSVEAYIQHPAWGTYFKTILPIEEFKEEL